MARPVRIHIPDSTYLVQLIARKGTVFFSSDDERLLFLDCLSEAAVRYRVRVYAFALMDRSILIFLRNSDVRLAKFVHSLIVGYINRLKPIRPVEKLIQDRHREILVEEETLFLHVLRRVHLAPVIGHHWSNASEGRKWGEISMNPWTSFPIYIGEMERFPGFDREYVFRMFRGSGNLDPAEAFHSFIMQAVKGVRGDILDYVVHMSLLGSPDFIEKYRNIVKGKWSAPGRSPLSNQQELLERLISLVLEEFGGERAELLKARSRHPGRKYLVELAIRYAMTGGGMKSLAGFFHVSGAHSPTRYMISDCFCRMKKRRPYACVPWKIDSMN